MKPAISIWRETTVEVAHGSQYKTSQGTLGLLEAKRKIQNLLAEQGGPPMVVQVTRIPGVTDTEKRVSSMKQMKGWGAMARGLMAVAIVMVFAGGLAFGQAKSLMQFQISHQFCLGSKVLPAGLYTFSVNGSWLMVKSPSGKQLTSMIISQLSGPSELFRDGSLVFDKTNSPSILSEVWIPGTGGLLLHVIPKNHERDFILGSSLSPTRTVSGKEAFNLTCAKCHGEAGKGDAGANKFFKTEIPKLNSEEVQAKSDAELRALIIQGDEKMPPVEIDEVGYRHRLPPQDVDAVIAYLRTLKK